MNPRTTILISCTWKPPSLSLTSAKSMEHPDSFQPPSPSQSASVVSTATTVNEPVNAEADPSEATGASHAVNETVNAEAEPLEATSAPHRDPPSDDELEEEDAEHEVEVPMSSMTHEEVQEVIGGTEGDTEILDPLPLPSPSAPPIMAADESKENSFEENNASHPQPSSEDEVVEKDVEPEAAVVPTPSMTYGEVHEVIGGDPKNPDPHSPPFPTRSVSAASILATVDNSSEVTRAIHPHLPLHNEVEEKDDAVVQDQEPAPSILKFLAMLSITTPEFQVSALINGPLSLVRQAWLCSLVAAKLAWRSLWVVYIFAVVCAMLAMALAGGWHFVGTVAVEPVLLTENLNFDYTKPSPVAFIPVRRLVRPNQRLHLEVSLILPESDYNKRLGVFQVGAEFLSANGKVISTSSQPCMLKFKSAHVHFVETFFQGFSLLSGYSSESQDIRLKMSGITSEKITGVRIILKQRAEFSPGGGIPEIYAASLKLEAELHLLKRMLWNWRWAIFVWSSMWFFVIGLLVIAFVCCRPWII